MMQLVDSSNTFVAMFHGYNGTPERFNSLKELVFECFPNAETYIPKLPLSVFSGAKIENVIDNAIKEINEHWQKMDVEKRKSCKIILIGSSMGGVITRKVYLEACQRYFVEGEEACEWVERVDRVIYFAALLRGWSFNAHYNIGSYLSFKILELIGRFISLLGIKLIGFEFKRGSPFITELRIQSLRLNKLGFGNALAIQLLGTQDDIVSPNDNIDLVTGKQFIYLDVPCSNHYNVSQFDDDKGLKRKEIVKNALLSDKEELKKHEVLPSDDNFIIQDNEVTDVVFVIHGIRDYGYWTLKLANKIKKLGEASIPNKKYRTETSTYGYFPMGAFLLKQFRSSKVEWLMERYTENLATYPNASFSFVGHSNGTYLLARALQDYPSCKFKNIVLAGSVVAKKYDWEILKKSKRVEKVYNIVANNDWVVGIFPKTFQTLRIQDLGSGGYDGFSVLENTNQFKFIKGKHGAAVQENVWDDVAYIAVNGELNKNHQIPEKNRGFVMKLLGWISPFVVGLLIAGLACLGHCIYKNNDGLLLTVYMCLYIFVLYKILTWF